MSLANLPPLRKSLGEAGLVAQKRFGQHFLLDINICRKITKISGVSEGEPVLEVGPGPGGLTRALLEAGAIVTAIEKDRRFIPILLELAAAAPGRLAVIEADALAFEESGRIDSAARVVSNLPYNVGSALLVKWLTGSFGPDRMTLMFQAEVARRIVARPGERDYGRLSVLSQAIAVTRIAMTLPARVFTPPPKVESAVVQLDALTERPTRPVIQALQKVTAAAFGQRRKKLRSSIASMGGAELCVRAGIDPDLRAERLSVADFLALAQLTAES